MNTKSSFPPQGSQQSPSYREHARLLSGMYPQSQAERIASQYVDHAVRGMDLERAAFWLNVRDEVRNGY